MTNYHKSVLLQEAIEGLRIRPGRRYIDATLGGGGHSLAIIKRGGIVLGLDADQDAIDFVSQNLESRIKNHELIIVRGNFADIDKIAKDEGFEKVWGILFDLGVSSHQLETPQRGFSYLKSGPLDMRMDQGLGVKAADLLNALGKDELYEIFKKFGEEGRSRAISSAIVLARRVKPFDKTDELVGLLTKVYGFLDKRDFAKAKSSSKVFQALRIAVNDELGNLETALPKALNLLEEGGRIAVISFHSLEDRIVKNFFTKFEKENKGVAVTRKPIIPSEAEIEANNKSRGSKLRIFEARFQS